MAPIPLHAAAVFAHLSSGLGFQRRSVTVTPSNTELLATAHAILVKRGSPKDTAVGIVVGGLSLIILFGAIRTISHFSSGGTRKDYFVGVAKFCGYVFVFVFLFPLVVYYMFPCTHKKKPAANTANITSSGDRKLPGEDIPMTALAIVPDLPDYTDPDKIEALPAMPAKPAPVKHGSKSMEGAMPP